MRRSESPASSTALVLLLVGCSRFALEDLDPLDRANGGAGGADTLTSSRVDAGGWTDAGLDGGGAGPVAPTGGTGGGGSSGGAAGTGGSGAAGAGGTAPDAVDAGAGDAASPPVTFCGDGIIDLGEACDDAGESASCNANCSASACGDGVVNAAAGEECEPSLDPGCESTCEYGVAAALIHRFSFDESGTTLVDTVGSATGTVYGTSLIGNGELSVSASDQYADLSDGIVSSLVNATVEVWVTWNGSNDWERVFDFGTADLVPGPSGDMEARNYFAMTPRSDAGGLRVALSDGPRNADVVIQLAEPLPASTKTHVAVVVDDDVGEMQLYVDGTLEGTAPLVIGLSALDDLDNYLGRSQFSWDPHFTGAIHELRIYAAALSASEVLQSYEASEEF